MSVRTLGERLGCSKSTASRVLIELEDVGFIDTIKLGSFSRKQHRASEYRLTWLRCDLTGNRPTKRFMQYIPQFHEKDRTVSSEGQKTPARPQQDDCQPGNAQAHGPATSVHHVGAVDAGMGGDRPCGTTPILPEIYPGPDTAPQLHPEGMDEAGVDDTAMGDDRPCWTMTTLPAE